MGYLPPSRITKLANDPITYSKWDRWWAWRPVRTISGKRVWFTWCYWRVKRQGFAYLRYEIQYGTLFDILAHPDGD